MKQPFPISISWLPEAICDLFHHQLFNITTPTVGKGNFIVCSNINQA